MFNDADNRLAIATVIRDVVGNTAIIYPFWALGMEPGDWPALLRTPAGEAYGYVITRRAVSQTAGPGPAAADQIHEYSILAIRSYAGGSEDLFSAEIDGITGAMRAGQYLQITPECVMRINGVQWILDLYGFGAELCHVGQGSLEVLYRLC